MYPHLRRYVLCVPSQRISRAVQMCADGTCCHIVACVRVNVAVVVDVNSDAGAFGNLRIPRPRFVADATNMRGDRANFSFFFFETPNVHHDFSEYTRSMFASECLHVESTTCAFVSFTKNLISILCHYTTKIN